MLLKCAKSAGDCNTFPLNKLKIFKVLVVKQPIVKPNY